MYFLLFFLVFVFLCVFSFFFFFFFFSSRRRHTRFDYDWSSDVCSSDLKAGSRRSTTTRCTNTISSGSRPRFRCDLQSHRIPAALFERSRTDHLRLGKDADVPAAAGTRPAVLRRGARRSCARTLPLARGACEASGAPPVARPRRLELRALHGRHG